MVPLVSNTLEMYPPGMMIIQVIPITKTITMTINITIAIMIES